MGLPVGDKCSWFSFLAKKSLESFEERLICPGLCVTDCGDFFNARELELEGLVLIDWRYLI